MALLPRGYSNAGHCPNVVKSTLRLQLLMVECGRGGIKLALRILVNVKNPLQIASLP